MGANDTLTATLPGDTPSLSAHGGAGDDVLDASATANGALFGDDGNDRLLPGPRSVYDVTGGAGADELDGGPAGAQTRFLMGASPDGADQVRRGPGGGSRRRTEHRTAPVRLTEDGVADDGEAGEGDNIAPAVEILVGGAGADVAGRRPGTERAERRARRRHRCWRATPAPTRSTAATGTDTAVLDVADSAQRCEAEQLPAARAVGADPRLRSQHDPAGAAPRAALRGHAERPGALELRARSARAAAAAALTRRSLPLARRARRRRAAGSASAAPAPTRASGRRRRRGAEDPRAAGSVRRARRHRRRPPQVAKAAESVERPTAREAGSPVKPTLAALPGATSYRHAHGRSGSCGSSRAGRVSIAGLVR